MLSRRGQRRLSAVENNGQAQNDEEHHQSQTQQGRQGIIRKTKTAMECLHRFCGECIDKSIRLGRKECPTCRSHLASRRSLRDDPNHDALVLALFGDIDKYEEEELTFHEEERTRNKEFQVSYFKISKRQFKAVKARAEDKQPRRRCNARRRRDEWEREYERTYGNEEQELGTPGTQTSPANSIGTRAAQTSLANSNDPHGENEAEVSQECDVVSFGSHSEVPPSGDEEMPREGEAISSGSLPDVPPSEDEELLEDGEVLSSRSDPEVPPSGDEEIQEVEPESHPEVLPGGVVEVPREGESTSSDSHPEVPSSGDEELPRENEDISLAPHPEIEDEDNYNTWKTRRMQRIMEHFRSLDETGDLEIHLLLVPADKETTPALKWPFMFVPAKFTIDKLCKLVSQESPLAANEVEILVVKVEINMREGANPSFSKDDMKLLEDGHKTLGEALDGHPLLRKEYTLAFRKKENAN
ncbi:hypothetical protein ACFE04_017636 [Oxalis oulophora]